MENSSDIAPNMLPSDYRPNESEEFMNPMQLLYFRRKLEAWKAELLDDASETITGLSQENLHQPDQMDRAQIESNAALDLRTRDRERKLLQKIPLFSPGLGSEDDNARTLMLLLQSTDTLEYTVRNHLEFNTAYHFYGILVCDIGASDPPVLLHALLVQSPY